MPTSNYIASPEISAVTDTSVTVSFSISPNDDADDDQQRDGAVLPDAKVVIHNTNDGSTRAVDCRNPDPTPRRNPMVVRIDELEPRTLYDIDIIPGGGESAETDAMFFPGEFKTLATPPGALLATFATVSDLHFGEKVCGLGPSDDVGPTFSASDETPPYWMYANEAIVDEINCAGVDAVIVKGDLTAVGAADEFAIARSVLDRLDAPWYGVIGNHDTMSSETNGLVILGQPERSARTIALPGVDLILIDTVDPGRDGGVFPDARMECLRSELETGRAQHAIMMGHHPVANPRKRRKKAFGIRRDHSATMIELLAGNPRFAGYFAGHTHRNRSRTFDATGVAPFVEVSATKDYPVAWAHYRIYEGGYTQEVRRCRDAKCARWADATKEMYYGWYRLYALGKLSDRCFVHRW